MAKSSLEMFIQSASEPTERFYIPFSLPSLNTEVIKNPKGFQTGRMVELVGMPSSGKSTLALDLICNAQRLGFPVHYADVERSLDIEYAATIGVDVDTLQVIRAETAEQTLALVEYVVRNGTRLVIIDSVSFLIPEAHLDQGIKEDEMPDYEKALRVASLGSLLGTFVKRMTPILDYHNALLVFINQYRANFSTMSRVEKKPYGPWAYQHGLTWRLELAAVETKEDRKIIEVKNTKNRLGKERGMTRIKIEYGMGADVAADILTCAVQRGIVTANGSHFYYGDQKAHGEKNAKALFDMEALRRELEVV